MKRLDELFPASSAGPGWRSQGANVGTGALISPDPIETALSFRKAKNRKVSDQDRPEWEVQAARMGLAPEDVVRGWTYLMNQPQEGLDPVSRLKRIFETALWAGYYGGIPGLMPQPADILGPKQDPEKPEDMQKPKRKLRKPTYEAVFVGTPVMSQAPQDGNPKGQAQLANEVPPAFPFATQSAYKVWEAAQHFIPLYPTYKAPEILRLGIEASKVPIQDLTPEDLTLLQMAVDWAQNGPPQSTVRTGGTPGGPFRSTGYKGAP